MKTIVLLVVSILPLSCYSQVILDSCFQSAVPGISFQSSFTLANSTDADLVQWNGTDWTGSWPDANVDLPPPCNAINSRAIWMGDQTYWTTGGEGFSAKLSQSLVAGTTYSFTFTYVSNGIASDGNFSPYFKTNSSADYATSYLVGQLAPAGYDWETHTFSFTAVPGQNGDNWILIHSNDGSGMVLSACEPTGQIELGTDTVLCFGDTLTLSASAGYNTYTWNTGDTTSSLAVTSPGTYIVEGSTASCIATDTIQVDYIPCDVPQTAFESNDTALCEKFCIDYTDESTNDPISWHWIFPGGIPAISSAENPADICYNIAGTFDVTLITTNINGSDTLTLLNYITVYPTPPFPIITQAGYTLTSSPATSYQWQYNAVDIPGATNQSYTISQSGFYTVIVGDANGCKNSSSTKVFLSGIDDVNGNEEISVYPNPSDGSFIVEWLNVPGGEISIDVINILGQNIFSSTESRSIGSNAYWKKEMDLSKSESGVYFIEIKTKNHLVSKKIIIAK